MNDHNDKSFDVVTGHEHGSHRAIWGAVTALAVLVSGCVTVKAPDKPIVINLNINIKQEVVYRLDGDAKALIEQNKDIF